MQAECRKAWSLVILIVSGLQLLGSSLVLLANPVPILSQKAATLTILQAYLEHIIQPTAPPAISQVFIVLHSILSSVRNSNAGIALSRKP